MKTVAADTQNTSQTVTVVHNQITTMQNTGQLSNTCCLLVSLWKSTDAPIICRESVSTDYRPVCRFNRYRPIITTVSADCFVCTLQSY